MDDEKKPHADHPNAQPTTNIEHLRDVMESLSAQRLMDIFANGYCALSLIVLTPEGIVVYANAVAINGFPGVNQETIKGKHLADLMPSAWAQERIGYMQQAAQTGKTVPMVDLLSGTRLYTTLRPIEIEHHGHKETLIFITVEPVSPIQLQWIRSQFQDGEIIMAEHIDLGRLSVLTAREIEVLALMGQGLRQKEIATKLCRSISTIDRHRERIGEKLGIKDRADLITIAREAGLEVEDAHRTHLPVKPKS